MEEQKTICPVLEQNIQPIAQEYISPVIDFLLSESPLPESSQVFPIGTITHDGRLDLCKQNLGVDGAAMIVDALKRNKTVKHLLLGTNAIGDEGAKILSDAIQYNTSLETLYLGCNKIQADGAIALCKALEENKDIKSVWFKRNPIGRESVPALVQLLKKNSYIRTLDLVNTCLEDGFFDLFEYFKENESLERLYLSGNYLNSTHLESFADVLKSNNTLKALFISVNNFADEGAIHLAEGLKDNNGLEELSIASCGIQEKGMLHLIKALENHKSIKYLDLGYAPSTRILQSQSNEISDLVAEKLLELLEKLPNLIYLNLTKTNLSAQYKPKFLEYQGKTIIIEGAPNKNTFNSHPDAQSIKSVYR